MIRTLRARIAYRLIMAAMWFYPTLIEELADAALGEVRRVRRASGQ